MPTTTATKMLTDRPLHQKTAMAVDPLVAGQENQSTVTVKPTVDTMKRTFSGFVQARMVPYFELFQHSQRQAGALPPNSNPSRNRYRRQSLNLRRRFQHEQSEQDVHERNEAKHSCNI